MTPDAASPSERSTLKSEAGSSRTPLLEVRDLRVAFTSGGHEVTAVDGISFAVYPGQTVAIVGESGSGKSTTAHAIINLLPGTGRVHGGSMLFAGEELVGASRRRYERLRGDQIGFVPQDPMSNLNPVWSVGFQVRETLRANGLATTEREAKRLALDVLRDAGLEMTPGRMRQFPHQFSGGMRQRVLIGIGMAAEPPLLIADEPTSALDVTVQRRILDNLADMTQRSQTAVLLITHDLGLAAERAEHVIVMHRGRIVESGPSAAVLQSPRHSYTQRLIAAAPSIAARRAPQATTGATDSGAAPRPVDPSTALPAFAIEIEGVTKRYHLRGVPPAEREVLAVDDVSFAVPRASTTAIVGESGSGKSTLARLVLALEKPTSGSITVDGLRTDALSRRELMKLRRRMQPVFQDPYGSLNPMRDIGDIIAEPLVTHRVGTPTQRRERVAELLDQVSLPRILLGRYPDELSGGQRQRIAIARALALKPDIVILDEAVSALDVLVQAQILDLLRDLQRELGLTYLFITHDLAVVREFADTVCVMEKGKLVERASTEDIFTRPQQRYTRELLGAIPGAAIPLGGQSPLGG